MYPTVCFSSKSLVTEVTPKGFVACVCSLVTFHVRHGLKRLFAELTLVSTDAFVIFFVRPEFLQLVKLFPAKSAESRERGYGRSGYRCFLSRWLDKGFDGDSLFADWSISEVR